MAIPTPAAVAAAHKLRLEAEIQHVTNAIVDALNQSLYADSASLVLAVSPAAQGPVQAVFAAKGWRVTFGVGSHSWVEVTAAQSVTPRHPT